jgi:hypothetical protein
MTVRTWLRANGHNTAPLTGQDASALEAIALCWELYARGDNDGRLAAVKAVRELLPAMQEKCWPLAREVIAKALDWGDRDRLWPLVKDGAK